MLPTTTAVIQPLENDFRHPNLLLQQATQRATIANAPVTFRQMIRNQNLDMGEHQRQAAPMQVDQSPESPKLEEHFQPYKRPRGIDVEPCLPPSIKAKY